VQHTLLPHEPWIYLPSGHQSRPPGNDPVPGINRVMGFDNPDLTTHNHQRHLLQEGFVDHEIGRLLARLRRTGLLDDALLVVTADHGYAFEVGTPSRREVTESNIEQIASVPLFVKAPGQTSGKIDPALVRNMDIVPTIADLLNVRLDWRHDGYSAFSKVTRARKEVSIPRRDFSRVISIGGEELERRRHDDRVAWARTFGTGAESEQQFGDPWASVYRIGPHQELLGRAVGELPAARPNGVRARVANADLLRQVDPSGRLLPTRVTGRLNTPPRGELHDMAVAVNGRIEAVGRSFHLHGRRPEYFSFMLPEDSVRPGSNRVQVFEVLPGGALLPVG
jgi:Sulfatase